VSAHENPCALNVKKTFDKQKIVYPVFSGFEMNRVYFQGKFFVIMREVYILFFRMSPRLLQVCLLW